MISVKKYYLNTLASIIGLILLSLPALAQKIPTPEEIMGFEPGTDYRLLTYEQSLRYYKALADATDMVKLEALGQSSMGKPMVAMIISSSENMANLERYREISLKLAHAKGLIDEQAKALAQQGKAIVYIDAGMHANEIAAVQALPHLAYELLTSEEPYIKEIREKVIVILLNVNPDGQTMIADWYHTNLSTRYELSPMPWIYNKYTGHDNNHDSMLLTNEVLNKTIFKIKRWHVMIQCCHHQTAPFPARLYVYPGEDPINPNSNPLVIRWRNFIASNMALHMDYHDMPGTISLSPLYAPQGTWNGWDTWFFGYTDTVGDYFNSHTVFTETAGSGYATPKFYSVRDFPAWAKDLRKSTLYASPWKGGWWRLMDAVNVVKISSLAICEVAAQFKDKLLYSIYLEGKNTIKLFTKEPPFAYIIHPEQRDPLTTAYMLSRFEPFDIEIYQAQEDFVANGQKCRKGSYVIPMNQAYALYVKAVMEVQHYPELYQWPGGPPTEPDEVVGWTFPYLFGIDVIAANHPLKVKLARVDRVEPPQGELIGDGNSGYILGHEFNNSFIALNRLMKSGAKVSWAKKSFSVNRKIYPVGTIIIDPQRITPNKIKDIAKELSLKFTAVESIPKVPTIHLKPINIGLYRSWVPNMDEGFTRWILDNYEFPYENVYDAGIRAGNLGNRFNVILIPSRPNARPMTSYTELGVHEGVVRETMTILHGHAPGTVPPQYTGGITERGADNLRKFVNDGGTLVCIGTSCLFAIEQFHLPVKDVVLGMETKDFYCPGSLVKVISDINHPVGYGMEESSAGFFWNNSVFELQPVSEGSEQPKVITRYADNGLFLSGWLIGEKYMRGKAAIVEVPYGKGKIILHGFRVKFRGWPHSTFKLFFNSLYYGPSAN